MEAQQRLGFSDIFKDKFLDGLSLTSQNLTLPNVIINLAIAFALGLFIYFVYRRTFRGVLYSHSFNLSLIMLSMVTTLVIMCISSNPALSLGMVGALSIVRFRTAVKDPIDTVYMFWAIAVGITLGANLVLFALVGSLVIGIVLFLMNFIGTGNSQNYLLVVHHDETAARAVYQIVHAVPRARLKSKTISKNGEEATYEVRLPNNRTGIVNKLLTIDGVYDATLVVYQNEIA